MHSDYDLIDLLDMITYSRPLPNRDYDQIYMKASGMIKQAMYINKYIADRNMLFLGDGDTMSILIGSLSEKKIINKVKSITIMDFDERIINNIKTLANTMKISAIPIQCNLYNVIMPIPKEDFGKYDFFFINPPYGSFNNGLSCIIWIDRCLDLCVSSCLGCIIIPYDYSQSWSIDNMKYIQNYLLQKGFLIKEMITGLHQYHLKDNPELSSSALIVERIQKIKSNYEGQWLSTSAVKNLYGKPKIIPKYIYISNEDIYGKKDFNWEYGKDNFWN